MDMIGRPGKTGGNSILTNTRLPERKNSIRHHRYKESPEIRIVEQEVKIQDQEVGRNENDVENK